MTDLLIALATHALAGLLGWRAYRYLDARPWGFILAELAAIGYVGWWDCLRASDVGAPHRRERVFLFAQADADADGPGVQGRDAVRRGGGERAVGACGVEVAPDATPSGGTVEPTCSGGEPSMVSTVARTGNRASERHLAEGVRGMERGTGVAWGAYEPAIARWEHVLGRAAPAPVDERGWLTAGFTEWMMGFPEGWVTDLLSRKPALRCIGNAVVPQVAAVVGAWLLEMAAAPAHR